MACLTTLQGIALIGRLSSSSTRRFKLLRGGSVQQLGTCPKKPATEVAACMATMCHSSSLFNDGPTAHWLGPETLVSLEVEGREVTAMANSSSQVITMMPNHIKHLEFPVLPLVDLVDHLLNLVGLGGMRTSPMGFVILWVQVMEITGYDEDVVFLVVPDELEFSRCMPLVLGMCTLCRIVNVIKESELNRLSTLWSTARTLRLLSRWGMADLGSGADLSSWRLTPPRRGWVQCCLRSRMMAAIIPLPLGVTPSCPLKSSSP